MFAFLLTLLILDALVLSVVVLLQAGQGGGLASMGGGGTDTVLGGRQAVTILTKLTWWCGGIFLVLSLVLSFAPARCYSSALQERLRAATPAEPQQGSAAAGRANPADRQAPGTHPAPPASAAHPARRPNPGACGADSRPSAEKVNRAFVLLEDGAWFAGTSPRSIEPAFGEVVFTTNLTGYQETFTDPSYLGQIVVMTAPMIGNYGVNPEDSESDHPQVTGVVVRELSRHPPTGAPLRVWTSGSARPGCPSWKGSTPAG